MPSPKPRCTIQIVNVIGEVVPILDWGAVISPGTKRAKYREYWTEEEDLYFVYRQSVTAPDGTVSTVDWPGGVHGNFGYELLIAEATGKFSLRIDYFTLLPSVSNGKLDLAYEPMSVSVTGMLGRANRTRIETQLQAGFSEQAGQPEFKYLRVTYK